MSIFMGTTSISADRTVSQIQALLAKHGALQVLTEYSNGNVAAVSFNMIIDKTPVPFRLPCRYKAIESKIDRKRHEDEIDWSARLRRIAWRQVYRWIEAQCAMIETGMVATEEVFLPYMQGKNGQTLFEHFQSNESALLGYESKKEPSK